MRPHLIPALILLACGLAGCGPTLRDTVVLEAELRNAEAAFARTMAERDFDGFLSYIADDAVFVDNGVPLRGKAQIAARWRPYFEGESAPFSWQPESVLVLDSGTLGQTDGPVFSPDGAVIARFRSVWRQERLGVWHVVFDAGYTSCKAVPDPVSSPVPTRDR